MNCSICNKRESETYSNLSDYQSHIESIKLDKSFIEIEVGTPLYNVGFDERWFKCDKCLAVWRSIEPDPPFNGLWKKVNSV
jgi:hypothetical protein